MGMVLAAAEEVEATVAFLVKEMPEELFRELMEGMRGEAGGRRRRKLKKGGGADEGRSRWW